MLTRSAEDRADVRYWRRRGDWFKHTRNLTAQLGAAIDEAHKRGVKSLRIWLCWISRGRALALTSLSTACSPIRKYNKYKPDAALPVVHRPCTLTLINSAEVHQPSRDGWLKSRASLRRSTYTIVVTIASI